MGSGKCHTRCESPSATPTTTPVGGLLPPVSPPPAAAPCPPLAFGGHGGRWCSPLGLCSALRPRAPLRLGLFCRPLLREQHPAPWGTRSYYAGRLPPLMLHVRCGLHWDGRSPPPLCGLVVPAWFWLRHARRTHFRSVGVSNPHRPMGPFLLLSGRLSFAPLGQRPTDAVCGFGAPAPSPRSAGGPRPFASHPAPFGRTPATAGGGKGERCPPCRAGVFVGYARKRLGGLGALDAPRRHVGSPPPPLRCGDGFPTCRLRAAHSPQPPKPFPRYAQHCDNSKIPKIWWCPPYPRESPTKSWGFSNCRTLDAGSPTARRLPAVTLGYD